MKYFIGYLFYYSLFYQLLDGKMELIGNSYLQYFNWLTKITVIGYMEPGFTLLTSINSTLFNYTTQLGCLAFLCIIPIAWKYKKISPYPLFSLLIWYATTFANIFPVRQNIAIALFVLFHGNI